MFGQPAANTFGANTQGNSLFGQSNTNTTGAFGGTTQTGGFGQPTTGTTFGQPATGTTFGQPATGTTFGQPATGTTFGQPANNTFGQPTSNTFGNQTTTGFGASTFGQNKPTLTLNTGVNQPKPTTSLFGNTQTNTGFGQNKTGFGQSNIFGGQPAQQTNMFGQSTFGQQQNQFQSQTFQNNNQQAQALDQVKAAASAFDPSSPACVFKVLLAQQQNPDPTCMVPVLAVGFDGLKKRSEIQNEQLATHKEKLAEIQEKIVKLEQTRTISTIIKIEEYKRKHRQLVHKVFQLLKSVQLLRNKGYILRPEEEALITRLISMDRDLAKPSVFRGRINEIWAQVQQFKDVEPVSVSIDPQSIKPLYSALEGMGKGLMELTNVCREDDSTLSQIERAYMEASLK
ncbi:Nuclear pore complex protein Nup54 [Boothiomyces macroporosus]|uniref:Nuclear pore complex protein Nup54 n=1 Tax=Boothiomyces macroporosus TaxID=261099 RepID=A0AAD5UHD0_9FUNG|nr:Nuclear pore complex protein Nup54 [Boothiomyces macroporosus]